jgi:DNA helicase-2/ATP-dependent DNA helicase PcrA
MNLSPKQQEIVDVPDPYCYVIAGAGSGKTRTLTERIRKLISESKHGEKVLAITFSDKAANELNDRLSQYYAKDRLQELAYVGAIRDFCKELVLGRASAIGLNSDLHIFESAEDRFEIFVEALDSVPQLKQKYIRRNSLNSKGVHSLFDALSKAKRNFKFPSDYAHNPSIQMLYQEYNDRMSAQNAIDLDDILLYAYEILSEKESIAKIYRRIYKHICIDEAQNLNKAQYEVIKSLAGASSSIFMVGDPSRAIYGFNGSSSKFMNASFPQDFGATKFVLTENYRSSRSVIHAAKTIEPSFEMDGLLPINGECTIQGFDNEDDEALWIHKKLTSLLEQGHSDIEGKNIEPSQCAVLARNKYVFSSLEKALSDNNVEYHVRASASQVINSESTVFKIFDLSLRLLMNPKDKLHFSELIKILGINSNAISTFQELRNNSILDNLIGEHASKTINTVWNMINSMGANFRFDKVLSCFEEYCSNEDNFANDNDRFLTFNDYSAWSNRWNTYVNNSSIDDRSLSAMMRSIALGVTNTAKEQGLTLSTVHMSKGLEFDVVFIIGMNEGTFPDYRALNDVVQLEEEKHNMFVSITRSKRLCYLTFPFEKVMPWGGTKRQKPSRYLQQLGWKPE